MIQITHNFLICNVVSNFFLYFGNFDIPKIEIKPRFRV